MSSSCQAQLQQFIDTTNLNLFNAEVLVASAPDLVPKALVQQTIGAIDSALSKLAEITESHNCDSNGLTRDENEAIGEAKELEKLTAETSIVNLDESEVEPTQKEVEPTQKEVESTQKDESGSEPATPGAAVQVPQFALVPYVAVPEPTPISRPDKDQEKKKIKGGRPNKTKDSSKKARGEKTSKNKKQARGGKAAKKPAHAKAKAKAKAKTKARNASSAGMDDDTHLRKKMHSVTWLLTVPMLSTAYEYWSQQLLLIISSLQFKSIKKMCPVFFCSGLFWSLAPGSTGRPW